MSVGGAILNNILNDYFNQKKEGYGTEYNLSPNEYIDKYHVTNVYALQIDKDNSYKSILLSCEQCDVVYIENLSYDKKFYSYSFGKVIYDWFLKKMILKGKKVVFLNGGDFNYKKMYGGIEDTTYNVAIYRYFILNCLAKLRLFIIKQR